jgi:hypothetical protein
MLGNLNCEIPFSGWQLHRRPCASQWLPGTEPAAEVCDYAPMLVFVCQLF